MLTLDELKAEVEAGAIDTVVVAFTDMQGRLMGKRLHAEFFCEEMADEHPVEGCNYLLALDMEMDPIPGLRDRELGARLRRLRDEAGSRDAAADSVARGDRARPLRRPLARRLAGRSRRRGRCCKAQMDRAAALGFTPMTGSELEFYLLRETYEEAWAQRYEDLTPSVPYILDYHILATTYDEDLIRQIRNGMHGAGIKVETSKGEAWPGQHEINFRFADALTMADNHVIYKNGAKEIANANGCSITFMAKPFESWIGNSCHIHASLFRDGEPAFRDDPVLFDRFLAGHDRLLQGARDLPRADDQLVQALRGRELGADDARVGAGQPNVRVPPRRARSCAAGRDEDPGRRRQPVSRVRGDDRGRSPRDRERARAAAGLEGNAYESDAERFPSSLREAILALEIGTMARAAFGDQVVDHYLNYAHTEQALFDKVVTDWERMRLFERG